MVLQFPIRHKEDKVPQPKFPIKQTMETVSFGSILTILVSSDKFIAISKYQSKPRNVSSCSDRCVKLFLWHCKSWEAVFKDLLAKSHLIVGPCSAVMWDKMGPFSYQNRSLMSFAKVFFQHINFFCPKTPPPLSF